MLNAAARLLTSTHKFDRGLSRLLHNELHWLDIPERVKYKLGVMHVRLPARSSSTVSDRLLSTGLRRGVTAAPPFSQSPVDVFWSYRVTVSARTAAGLLPSLARRPGTLSRIIYGIRTLLWTTLSACWKRFCSQRSAISALCVTTMRCTNFHFTYILNLLT